MNFIRGANPIWFFSNLVGAPLDDTYYAFFLTNTLPYVPQSVFEDPNGQVVWSNPIEFQPSSGLPNNIYFDDTLVYRIEIRQGPTQNDPLIYLIENYVPADNSPTADIIANAENLITNPQFADVYFSPVTGYTFSQVVSGTYTIPVGPGWNLVLVGTGTTILQQVPISGQTVVAGDIPTNPPYYLTINNSGWTSATMVQTFSNNGAIFNGGAIACYLLANATTNPVTFSVSYAPSTGNAYNIISPVQVNVGTLRPIVGSLSPVPASTNSQSGTSASVNININLPSSGIISLTNIQIIGQSTPLANGNLDIPLFQEISYERVIDQEFHVYKNSLLIQPKNTILTGWNFGLNPWQFTSTASANLANNAYTADQTIVVQQAYVNAATANNVQVGQAALANNYGLQITAATAHNNFAIIQYIDPATIRPYWGNFLSALVYGLFSTSHGTAGVQFKMRLIYKAGLPTNGGTSQTYPIASWTEGQDPVFDASFTVLKPNNGLNDPVYTFGSSAQGFPFNSFLLPASTNANMTLGIVVYTISNMNQNATADFVVFNDVSLVPNIFAMASQASTFDEVLRKCQYYYSKSFAQGTVPAQAATRLNALSYRIHNTGTDVDGVLWQYPVPMRITPTMTSYSTDLSTTAWYNSTASSASGACTFAQTGTNNVFVTNAQAAGDNGIGQLVAVQVTADARI